LLLVLLFVYLNEEEHTMETYDIRNTQRQYAATGTDKWVSPSPRMLVYTPYAAKRQMEIIGWRRDDHPENRREQGGWLIGKYILDPAGTPVQGEVTHVLEAKTECRFPGYIEWDALEEIRLQQTFFQLQEELAKTDPITAEQLTVLGWWHTHPNALDVFLSSTDMETVRLKYYKPEKYSVVLNPHRGIFRAFAGRNATEVPVIMLLDGRNEAALAKNPEKGPNRNTSRRKKRRMKKNRKRK
jgi:proteasome lid subunit RPN8/RPN11